MLKRLMFLLTPAPVSLYGDRVLEEVTDELGNSIQKRVDGSGLEYVTIIFKEDTNETDRPETTTVS